MRQSPYRKGDHVRLRAKLDTTAFVLEKGAIGVVTSIPRLNGKVSPDGVRVGFKGGTVSKIAFKNGYKEPDVFLFYDEIEPLKK